MTSVVNGTVTRNGPHAVSGSSSSNENSNTGVLNSTATYTSFQLDNEFAFDFLPTSTWETLEPASNWDTGSSTARPDSRQSLTPVSTPTPRPPSQPDYNSPATTIPAQSPLSHFVAQPSPSVGNPATPASSYTASFNFSPLGSAVGDTAASTNNYHGMEGGGGLDDQKENKIEESIMESGRLRTLLTKPPVSLESNVDNTGTNTADTKNRILIGLLNHQDEDESGRMDNRSSPRGGRGSTSSTSSFTGGGEIKTSTSGGGSGGTAGGNNILLQKVRRGLFFDIILNWIFFINFMFSIPTRQ